MIYQIKKFIRKLTPNFVLSFYHLTLVWLAAFINHFPGKKLVVIGVTGTKGKTTVCELVNYFFEKSGQKTAVLNSLRFKIGDKSWSNNLKMTMPGRFFIQKFLRRAVSKKCNYAIVEVTSEGIKQHRHRFIDFDVAVFTNLQPEHLESHGNSLEKYRQAKEKLFASLKSFKKDTFIRERRGRLGRGCKKFSVINLDDAAAEYFFKYPADYKIGFGFHEVGNLQVNEKLYPANIKADKNGISFHLNGTEFRSPLIGEFNVSNILAAIAVGRAFGISLNTIKEALAEFDGIPGRMEEIKSGQDFKVFIDFAHTPDSLRAVLETLKNDLVDKDKKLICVFGSTGGGRDKWKRPAMGRVAAEYCDEIFITNDDPYDENPRQIMEQVAVGVKTSNKSCEMIEDRREAISKALKKAKAGDCVVITGKGSEQAMVLANGKKIPWDDRKVTKEELGRL